MRDVEKDILTIFYDSSKRPKITPRHESAIMVRMENKYTPSQVQYSLKKLEEDQLLFSIKHEIKEVGSSKFYFLGIFDKEKTRKKIKTKVNNYSKWIQKYSSNKVTTMLGEHLQDLVKAELRAQNFKIMSKQEMEKIEKLWSETRHKLDIIAWHKQKESKIGMEIKNMLSLTPIGEVEIKIKMCKKGDLIPVFACRWMEAHRKFIEKNNGFLWQFKNQLYPRGQENFVNVIRKRFKFPVIVSGEIPGNAKKHLENWLSKY